MTGSLVALAVVLLTVGGVAWWGLSAPRPTGSRLQRSAERADRPGQEPRRQPGDAGTGLIL
ncbi:hypothetical protein G5V58_10935 [Nocardioides anomalus]|uniref:Uncharacterized protein n=1 Tax=Nocardioides anomalus TaxID=2712223 RepID=A0A6G6WCX8_9ACTN|nr:hypothetical protein [Nocardioides anomalus]QIG43201.1 hypothetical protein G5V58_10935 [Nocardioides anomalus]